MCKMICVLNKNPQNKDIINRLIDANLPELTDERDGWSVYRDGHIHYSLDYENFGALTYDNEKVWITHFRLGTGGERGLGGLHLQRLNKRFVYAHNGSVGAYHNVKTKNDSHHFFAEMIKHPVTIHTVRQSIMDKSFWGKGILYDETRKRLHILAEWEMNVYGLPDCLIFSSFPLMTIIKQVRWTSILGMPFLDMGDEDAPFLYEGTVNNKYITFLNGKFEGQEDIDLQRQLFDAKSSQN